jgi:hypothetical protein
MVSLPRPIAKSDAVLKNVQALAINASALPAYAVLLSMTRTLELQLQRRSLLKAPTVGSFTPVWFVAETERNVFLWRRGLSLIQQDEFEFWVDLPKLVAKRLHQLESADADNPFTNPLWASSSADPDLIRRESEYLESLLEIIARVGPHAHAFSRASAECLKEYFGYCDERPVVLLPAG